MAEQESAELIVNVRTAPDNGKQHGVSVLQLIDDSHPLEVQQHVPVPIPIMHTYIQQFPTDRFHPDSWRTKPIGPKFR